MRLAPLALAAAAALLAGPKPFGRMTDIGGRRVHLHCEGPRGAGPLVLLVHGTPRFSFHFALVLSEAAKFARVCVYDRAGDAWSEPVPGQPTARIFIDELDRVIRHLSPQSPVVLAGHSAGGVLARAYFAEHPERVAALVLIDTAALDSGAGKRMADATDADLRKMADEAASRPKAAAPKPSLAAPFDKLPKRFHAAHLWATAKWQAYAQGVDVFQALKYQADLYKLAARAASATLPVRVLSRAENTEGATHGWGRAKLVRVPRSGHDIQLDQPGAVATAIREAATAANPAR